MYMKALLKPLIKMCNSRAYKQQFTVYDYPWIFSNLNYWTLLVNLVLFFNVGVTHA